jgi:hypothetical protein
MLFSRIEQVTSPCLDYAGKTSLSQFALPAGNFPAEI